MTFCPKCGKQLPDDTKFCKYCGAQLMVQSNMQSVPLNGVQRVQPTYPLSNEQNVTVKKADEPRKSPKKIILSVVAVVLVIAIVATGLLIYKKVKDNNLTDEERLTKILEESTDKPIIEMVCKDYDSDGTFEAYAVVSDEDETGKKEYRDADIYFVNQTEAQAIKENVDGKVNGIIATDERIYISLEIEVSEDESYSFIYTADGENAAESEISGEYSDVHQEGGKIFATDENGEKIEIKMPDGIVDVNSGNGKKKENKTEPEEETTEPPAVDNYESDLALYKDYFANGGLDSLLEESYFSNNGYLDIKSCMFDLNDDKTYELLLSVADTEYMGVRGYQTIYVLLAIQNGSVVSLDNSYYGGGSGGGDALFLQYDTVEQKPVIISDSLVRDGSWASTYWFNICRYDGKNLIVDKELESGYYSADYYTYVDEVKAETDLYVMDDYGGLRYFKIDGSYVTEAEYDESNNRYVDIADDSPYQMKSGTYSNPIAY